MAKRIINLGGGAYNANIEGDYIQGRAPTVKQPRKIEQPTNSDADTVNTNGANYVEILGDERVDIIID